jgi:hypothetical protein
MEGTMAERWAAEDIEPGCIKILREANNCAAWAWWDEEQSNVVAVESTVWRVPPVNCRESQSKKSS